MPNHVVWFKEINKHDIPLVGGKGANLGELTQAGINVPPGFIVTAQSFFYFLDQTNIRKGILSNLKDLDVNNSDILQKISEGIKTLIRKSKMPLDIQKEILSSYQALTPPDTSMPPVAVRSSATAEDLPDASFAGQQATFLNVSGEDNLLEAVKACWASLFEPRAIFYRTEKGFDHEKVGIAVIVQRMVQSEKAGVMFTVDPISYDHNKLLIEAGYGLGEAVVAGEISPDEYLVEKNSLQIINKTINQQEWQTVRKKNSKVAAELEELNEKIPIPSNMQFSQKLTDSQIKELSKLGIAIEKHYNFPQDTEWAIENNTIYLVQSRPITTLPKQQQSIKSGKPMTTTATQSPSPSKEKILLEGASASPGIAAGPVRIVINPKEIGKVKQGDVLVAEMTTPDYVPAMKKAVAIVTDSGGRTCHAAIVSRELGIPCVVGTKEATKILKDNQIITINASRGLIYEGDITSLIQTPQQEKKEATSAAGSYSPITATKIYVNLAAPDLAYDIAQKDVDGVGLLRAEFIIANIGEHPRKMIEEKRGQEFVDTLAQGIGTIAEAFFPRPVVYRLTDFKTNEYKNLKGGERFEPNEANPMMGYRGCSRYLKDRDVFQLEVEMIKKIHGKKLTNLWIMVPFVRNVIEMRSILSVLATQGLSTTRDFKIWMMAEVPSNVILIDEFCQLGIDGISIGSNDLTQLTLGLDRDNETVIDLFDERDKAVLLSLQRIIESCRRYNVTCSICGQAPSVYPELTEKLIEWGITSISVNPDMIDQTRKIVARAEQKILLNQRFPASA